MSTLKNEFSWSFSRHDIFQSCLKRYYFTYYASWGGWQADAPAHVREVYMLKKLSTRFQWAGHHVHQAIADLIREERTPLSASMISHIVEQRLDHMRREFRQSRAGAYHLDPIHTPGLFEHEYRLELPPEEWKAVAERVAIALHRFLNSEVWAFLVSLPPDAFLSMERRSHFILDGLTVFAIPDLVVRQNRRILIYEWKTGLSPLLEHRMQLGTYVLLAMDRWTADPCEIEGIAYNPIMSQRESFCYSAGEVEEVKEFIRDSADEMLFP
ncbi:MAG: PD-(D/E)XK nuclease family protein, partial [Verrucomicrobiota bacterium]|nr:PD-(D/E)XK nuclease family protein [Verrucomicrobiota bacterium]